MDQEDRSGGSGSGLEAHFTCCGESVPSVDRVTGNSVSGSPIADADRIRGEGVVCWV